MLFNIFKKGYGNEIHEGFCDYKRCKKLGNDISSGKYEEELIKLFGFSEKDYLNHIKPQLEKCNQCYNKFIKGRPNTQIKITRGNLSTLYNTILNRISRR